MATFAHYKVSYDKLEKTNKRMFLSSVCIENWQLLAVFFKFKESQSKYYFTLSAENP